MAPEVENPLWTWNGDFERPTIEGSIKVTGGPEGARTVCHSVVTDGVINFCPDCTHAMRGRAVRLEPF